MKRYGMLIGVKADKLAEYRELHREVWPDVLRMTREYKRVYQKKGRPNKDTPSKITWKEVYSISFGIDGDAVNEEQRTDGVFPLITNLDPKTHFAKRVLEIYKFQPFLEKRFSQIKTYHEIGPVYLKKAERVVAYLHVHVMALMVAALIERQLRLAMKQGASTLFPSIPRRDPVTPPPSSTSSGYSKTSKGTKPLLATKRSFFQPN